MQRLLYFGLATIVIMTISIGLLGANYEAYGSDVYLRDVSKVANVYSLDNILCAFEVKCETG